MERAVGYGVLGAYDVAEVVDVVARVGDISVGQTRWRLDVEQFAHLKRYLHVEIIEICGAALKERAYVVGVVFEERRLTVGRHEGVPVQVPPIAVVADACVATLGRGVVLGGDGQCLRSVGCCYDATVAVSLFDEAVVMLYEYTFVAVQLLIPLHRTEVCR